MRTTNRSTAFRRDFKRALSNPHHRDLRELVPKTLALLAEDRPLPDRLRDHALGGPWRGYRECHVKPDLLLIYEKVGRDILNLIRLSTHSELFGK